MQFFKTLLLFLFFVCIASCSVRTVHNWEETDPKPDRFSAFWVTEIFQGDQIRLSDGILVKYAGIIAPNRDDPYFQSSRIANANLLGCKNPDDASIRCRVVLKFLSSKPDQNGFYQAYVYYPVGYDPEKGMILRFLNKELLEFGHAIVDPSFNSQPYFKEFLEAQEVAKESKRGLWEFKR